ncbi:hypothetical protein GCM10009772_23240 [Pseudonocardia alni subsp. carboxydivorans]
MPESRTFSKLELSSMASRIIRPTTMSRALLRKAIRQPHAAKASGEIVLVRSRNASWERKMPDGRPSCGKQP